MLDIYIIFLALNQKLFHFLPHIRHIYQDLLINLLNIFLTSKVFILYSMSTPKLKLKSHYKDQSNCYILEGQICHY